MPYLDEGLEVPIVHFFPLGLEIRLVRSTLLRSCEM